MYNAPLDTSICHLFIYFLVGRLRATPADAEEINYYQPAAKYDYERPDADTCGAWVIYDLLHNFLKVASPPNIKPVEHDGTERMLLSKQYMDRNKIQLTVNGKLGTLCIFNTRTMSYAKKASIFAWIFTIN
jgi:hypothetical protein